MINTLIALFTFLLLIFGGVGLAVYLEHRWTQREDNDYWRKAYQREHKSYTEYIRTGEVKYED